MTTSWPILVSCLHSYQSVLSVTGDHSLGPLSDFNPCCHWTPVSFLQEYYVKRPVCLSTPGCSGHILRMTGHVRHATAASLFIQFCLTAAVCGSSVCTEGMSPVTFHFSVSSACHSSDCRTLGNSWIIWSRVCTITAVAEGREGWNLGKEAIQLEPKQRFLIHFFWWQKSVASIKSMKNAI